MKRKRIQEQWDLFRKLIPPDAPTTQKIEMRRAFYAGANGLFATILNLLEPGAEATDADLAMLDDIQNEFIEFAELLRNGVA